MPNGRKFYGLPTTVNLENSLMSQRRQLCRTTIEEGLESSQPALLVRNLSLSMVEGAVHWISIDKKKKTILFVVVGSGFIPLHANIGSTSSCHTERRKPRRESGKEVAKAVVADKTWVGGVEGGWRPLQDNKTARFLDICLFCGKDFRFLSWSVKLNPFMWMFLLF